MVKKTEDMLPLSLIRKMAACPPRKNPPEKGGREVPQKRAVRKLVFGSK